VATVDEMEGDGSGEEAVCRACLSADKTARQPAWSGSPGSVSLLAKSSAPAGVPVPGQLDPIEVLIVQGDSLVGTVIGCPIARHPQLAFFTLQQARFAAIIDAGECRKIPSTHKSL
jgi:hypothetical protein